MSPPSLRFLQLFLYTASRSKNISRLPQQLRPYSSKRKANPLAPSRPDLQPQARRKQLQDSGIELYPRIKNSAVVQMFDEFKRKYYAMGAGVIDDKQLVTVRGVYCRTHCCFSTVSTRSEIIRGIMYYHRSIPIENMGYTGTFVYENPIYIFAQLNLTSWSRFLIRQRQNKELQRRIIKVDILRPRPGRCQAAGCI